MSTWSLGVAAAGLCLFLLLCVIRVALAPTGRHRAATAAGPVRTGYRYCPDELRTRAAVLHADGSARCADCGAHIPATTEEAPGA